MLDRQTPPQTQTIELSIGMRPETETLDNALPLNLLPMEHLPLVRLDFYFPGGKWVQDVPCQASLATTQMREGTASYSAERINELLDFYGATIAPNANFSYSTLTVVCLRKHLASILPIVRSMLTEPLYGDEHMQIALNQMRTVWQIDQGKVDYQARRVFMQHIYGSDHPMGRLVAKSDFDIVTPESLHAYQRRYLSSDNCSLYMTGGFTNDDLRLVRSTFGQDSWGEGSGLRPFVYRQCPPVPMPERHVRLEMPQPTVQSSVRMGRIMPPSSHPDTPLIRLVNTILGGYFGSRLMSSIRETKGLTYDISSGVLNAPHETIFSIASEMPNKNAEEVVEEIRRECLRLVHEPVGADELRLVKNYLMGNACRAYEPSLAFASVLISLLPSGRTIANIEEDNRRVMAATPEDIRRIAEQYFNPDSFVDVVAGKD